MRVAGRLVLLVVFVTVAVADVDAHVDAGVDQEDCHDCDHSKRIHSVDLQNLQYSFQFNEVSSIIPVETYAIYVHIDITNRDQTSAIFRFTVSNLSPNFLHLRVNTTDCASATSPCSNIHVVDNNPLFVELNRPGYNMSVLTFWNTTQSDGPYVYLMGCPETNYFLKNTCLFSTQANILYDRLYHDDLCFCKALLDFCAPLPVRDTCLETPWWNTTATTPGTTSFIPTTTPSETTTSLNPTNASDGTTVTTTMTIPLITTTNPTTTTMKIPPITTTTILTTTTATTSSRTAAPSQTTRRPETSSTRPPTTTHATSPPTTSIYPNSLQNLSDSGVGLNNVSQVLNETLTFSKLGPDLVGDQISQITTILQKSANLNGITPENSFVILENLDNVLLAAEHEMRNSNNSNKRILSLLPKMVVNTHGERIEYLKGINLGFSSRRLNCASRERDDGILDVGQEFELLNSTSDESTRNSIAVPISTVCGSQQVSHVFFTIYRKQKLFLGPVKFRTYSASGTPLAKQHPEDSSTGFDFNSVVVSKDNDITPSEAPSPCDKQVSLPESSPVMSATILDNNGQKVHAVGGEATMAVLRFNVVDKARPLHGRFRVTWWDVEREIWSTEQPCTTVSIKDGVVEGQCIHLTDFTIIVDGAINDPIVCDVVLMDLGYTVNAISIASLAFLVFVSICAYIHALSNTRVYRYIRGYSFPKQDLVTLVYHVDLLFFYLFFAIFSDQAIAGSACNYIAAITYTLLIGSVFLTIFQALRTIKPFMPPAVRSFFGFLLAPPLLLTVSIAFPFLLSLFLLVFTNFFARGDSFCWVRPEYVAFAIVIPVSILLLNSIFCSAFITYKLFFGTNRKFSRVLNHYHDPQIVSKVVAILIMQISLGMPWIVQFLTIYAPYTTAWHYVFTIVMGSQGTLLCGLFFYKRHKLVQESERESRRIASNNMNSSARIRALTREENFIHSESL